VRGSISRLLHISATTVISRIQKIADNIKKPAIITERGYEVDELKTYIKKKANDYWVIYAIDRASKQVVDFKAGKRNKKNLKRVIPHVRGCWPIANKYLPMGWIFINL